MMISLILNGAFIVVIAVGIVFVWRLQRTLDGLYKNRMEMEKFVADFSGSISRAQKAIRDLQDTARDVGQDVEGNLTRAQGLRDELSFLVEAADKIASRLSDSASAAQNDAKLARAQRAEKSQKQKEEPAPIIKKAEPPAPVQEPVQVKTVPSWVKRAEQNAPVINAPVEEAAPVSGLQFGARKSVQKSTTVPPPLFHAKEDTKEQPRSLAERELLQALEKMK